MNSGEPPQGDTPVSLEELEQVHVIGKNRRGLRLHWIAVVGVGLALLPAARAFGQATTATALSVQSSTQACSTTGLTTTLTTLTIAVTSSSGVPSGTVNIDDATSPTATPAQIASATLDATGHATVSLYLANGSHTLEAVYAGDSTYAQSTSSTAPVPISSQCDSTFAVSVSNIAPSSSSAMALKIGQSGTATVTVTPSQQYVASLKTTGAPGFITVSCSGLPSLATCTFTPENLAILPGEDAGVVSSMLLQTQAQMSGVTQPVQRGHRSSPVVWAILLPGILGLGGIAWGARRRRWLQRLSLLALVALVTTLGTTGCNPLYYYYANGPEHPPATPTGTFTVTVAGQSTNGVTAVTNTTTMLLTIQ